NEGKLTERLQQQGITLALAKALIDQVLAAGAFREDPKRSFIEIRQLNSLDGRTVDNGSRIWRALSISRARWYAYRAERLREDNKADKTKEKRRTIPENSQVLKLAKRIKKRTKGRSKMDVALEFTEGKEKEAKSLLRQLRRYPDLLK